VKIGDFDLKKNILVVAEIGNNHEGDYALAEDMIGLAAKSGAGAVKFQTVIPEKLVSIRDKDRISQLKKFQFTFDQFKKLSKTASKERILFISTPFDIESAEFLNGIVPAFKISSGDNDFMPLIEYIALTGKPIILSSGLTDLFGIKRTKNLIEKIWLKKKISQEMAILHCVSAYPVPLAQANLLAIKELQKLNVTAGYSDHTIGIEAAVISVALGARIIEKHFTIDKNRSDFRDHKLSADPSDLKDLVKRVKEIAEMLGSGEKLPQESEKAIESKVRRSITASRDLSKGTVISRGDIGWVRPGGGLPPGSENEVIGKTLRRDIASGEMILKKDIF
jgi:N-acetylneuraminate synthase/N,N'-diacetyllegionaminate synthase